MEDPGEEWETGDGSSSSSSLEEEKTEKSSMMGWILHRSLSLGKKVMITGIMVSSAPLVLPPLVVISAIGFAVSVPFGFVYASYTCSEKLMSKLLPETAPSQKLSMYEELAEDDDVNDENASFVEEGEIAETGNVSLGKENVVAREDDDENPFLVKGSGVGPDEEEAEESVMENLLPVKGGVLATEEVREMEKVKGGVEEAQNTSDVTWSVVAMEKQKSEQEEDLKEGIEGRIESVEEGRMENGGDYHAKVGESIKVDQEKVVSRGEILEEPGYEENESPERMDDIQIEEVGKDKENKELEYVDEKPTGLREIEEDEKLEGKNGESVKFDISGAREDVIISVQNLEVQPVDFVENDYDKNLERIKEEDISQDKNEDKNVEIREEEDTSERRTLEVKEDGMKVIREKEEETPLESNAEPSRVSEYRGDRKLEVQDTESLEILGDEGAGEDAKVSAHVSSVQPQGLVKNEDENTIGNRKQEEMSEDKNAKLDKDVPVIDTSKSRAAETEEKLEEDDRETNGSKKVNGDETISEGMISAVGTKGKLVKDVSEKKEKDNVNREQTVSKGKSGTTETEGREKRKNGKKHKTSGNRKGTAMGRDERCETSLGKVEKPIGEAKNLYENSDLIMVGDTQGNYKEMGKEPNLDISNSVPNNNKRGETEVILLDRGDADHSKITTLPGKSTDDENEMIKDEHVMPQGDTSHDDAGYAVYAAASVAVSDPGCEKSEEIIISQKVSSCVKAEDDDASRGNSRLTLTGSNEPEGGSTESVGAVALSAIPDLNHDVETKSQGVGNVREADSALCPAEDLLRVSDDKVWAQIDSVKAIIGYKEARTSSIFDEVKALYLFTGVEPPPSFEDSSDVAEVYNKLRFLMSVIGLK